MAFMSLSNTPPDRYLYPFDLEKAYLLGLSISKDSVQIFNSDGSDWKSYPYLSCGREVTHAVKVFNTGQFSPPWEWEANPDWNNPISNRLAVQLGQHSLAVFDRNIVSHLRAILRFGDLTGVALKSREDALQAFRTLVFVMASNISVSIGDAFAEGAATGPIHQANEEIHLIMSAMAQQSDLSFDVLFDFCADPYNVKMPVCLDSRFSCSEVAVELDVAYLTKYLNLLRYETLRRSNLSAVDVMSEMVRIMRTATLRNVLMFQYVNIYASNINCPKVLRGQYPSLAEIKNAAWDLHHIDRLTPFVGAGLPVMFFSFDRRLISFLDHIDTTRYGAKLERFWREQGFSLTPEHFMNETLAAKAYNRINPKSVRAQHVSKFRDVEWLQSTIREAELNLEALSV